MMTNEPMQKLDLGKWLEQADPMMRQRFIAAKETAKRLSDLVPKKQLLDMTRKIIKNQGRSNGSYYGFDCVQNPGNYTNIPN